MEGGGDMGLMEWCRELPKIELHAHLNGSVRDSTLLELAKDLGEKGVIAFEDVVHVIMKNGRSLPECFKLFDLYHLLTTDHQTVTRITKEVIEDFAAENVVYLELRTTPKKNEAKGMTKCSYMKAVIDGIRAVDTVDVDFDTSGTSNVNCSEATPLNCIGSPIKRKKIYVRLLLSIDRRETTAAALETVNLAMDLKNFGVVGIDLSGNPVIGEWQTFLPALKHAKELGLPITLHCGEVPNHKEIQAMLDICPQRIGHACFLVEEEWKRVKFLKIPVEICLTSNIRTERFSSIYDHFFADLYKAKHQVALCTDDSGLFSTTLSNEFYLAASTFGLNKDEMFLLARSAIQSTFADDEVKHELTKIFDDAANRLII
ncbi:N6-mAMP deaminase-like isoform X1 [Musa acuminata AAA Group]|uniref:Adenosine deaminase domain-containing protein n=2 Tax=Musa acuminata TaxID=4641 RepID=A0A804KR63_MUSAM|nr:PREDICTED: adenosine deaminase-like protein isoform X1 [Musa acuminata subsp. malaccensis]